MNTTRVFIILIVILALVFLALNTIAQFFKMSRSVQQPPVKNLTKLVSQRVSIRCVYPDNNSSTEIHKVKWVKDGSTFPSNRFTSPRVFQNEDTLNINSINKSDSGLYECRSGSNDTKGGRMSAGIFLNIEYPAEPKDVPEEVHLTNYSLGLVPCPVDANPGVEFVMWRKNKHFLDVSDNIYDTLPNGSLIIKSVHKDHEGLYKCTPYNIHGTHGTSSSMKVVVHEKSHELTRRSRHHPKYIRLN